MFTGLIETTGRISTLDPAPGGRRVVIATAMAAELQLGDSVSVSGVCLTVAALAAGDFSADVSPETLRVTTIGEMTAGRVVNLERPLRADGRLGGHFVLGHVDAVGRVLSLTAQGDHHWLTVEVPDTMLPYVVPKGSIAIDGISLTIASLDGRRVGAQIVPFTLSHTALHAVQPGDGVNLEADVIGKYVARLLTHPPAAAALTASIIGRHS